MSKEKKQRDIRYRTYRKEKNPKKGYYSIRSLVGRITGIYENDERFEAAYKDVERIIKTQQLYLNNVGKVKVSADQVEGFIAVTKAFYHGGEAREAYEKIRTGLSLNADELDSLINIFKDSLQLNPKSKENLQLIDQVNKNEQIVDLRSKIRNKIEQDLNKIDKLDHWNTQLLFLEEYWKELDQNIAPLRQRILGRLGDESTIRKLIPIARQRGIEWNTIDEEIEPLLLSELMKELVEQEAPYILEIIKDELDI